MVIIIVKVFLKSGITDFHKIKKVKISFHPFCPKSTINLTY